MNPLREAILLALLFAGSHVGLTIRPVRSRLVARLGEWGFRTVFFAVAATSFSLLVGFYADHQADGGPGLALGALPGVRAVLESIVVLGVTLMVAGFASYSGSPYDVDGGEAGRPPRGLERVTRHPFFTGTALFGTAHSLLAPHLVGAVLMGTLGALAIGGAWHQDRKLVARRGRRFTDYVAATSALPFAAIVAGRQRLVWRELPVPGIGAGLLVAALLRRVHDAIFGHHGAWVILVVVGSASILMLVAWLRDRRHPSSHPIQTRA